MDEIETKSRKIVNITLTCISIMFGRSTSLQSCSQNSMNLRKRERMRLKVHASILSCTWFWSTKFPEWGSLYWRTYALWRWRHEGRINSFPYFPLCLSPLNESTLPFLRGFSRESCERTHQECCQCGKVTATFGTVRYTVDPDRLKNEISGHSKYTKLYQNSF